MNSVKFNFVVMSAVCSMFISSKMGNEITYEVIVRLMFIELLFYLFTDKMIICELRDFSLQKYQWQFIQANGKNGRLLCENMCTFY